jgi:hypothetical protein
VAMVNATMVAFPVAKMYEPLHDALKAILA